MKHSKKTGDPGSSCYRCKPACTDLILRFLFFGMMLSFLACSSKDPAQNKEKAVTFNKFPMEQKLVSTDYFTIAQLKPDGLALYGDSVLFIRNAANSSSHHFSLFNLTGKTFISNQLESGRKEGQSLAFLSYGFSGNYLWVYDIVKHKLIFSNTDSALQGKNGGAREYDFRTFYYSVQKGPDSNIVAGGDYESPYKLFVLDLPTDSIEKKMIPYSTDSLESYPRAKKMAYESFLFLKPSGEKCVLASRYADRIEVVDLNKQKAATIKGPEIYEPVVVIMKSQDGKELGARGPDTRYAFVKGKVTNKYIYLLYSGNNHESEHLFYGKYIYVYDWNGQPVKKLELEDYVLDFAVTGNDSIMYTCDPVKKIIKISKL